MVLEKTYITLRKTAILKTCQTVLKFTQIDEDEIGYRQVHS